MLLEKQPRSRRISREDDDIYHLDAAEHVLDAPGLSRPVTGAQNDTGGASTSRTTQPR